MILNNVEFVLNKFKDLFHIKIKHYFKLSISIIVYRIFIVNPNILLQQFTKTRPNLFIREMFMIMGLIILP